MHCQLLALQQTLLFAECLSYEKSMVYETETETTVTQEVEGDEAEINNVEGNMYKDNSVHNE